MIVLLSELRKKISKLDIWRPNHAGVHKILIGVNH